VRQQADTVQLRYQYQNNLKVDKSNDTKVKILVYDIAE